MMRYCDQKTDNFFNFFLEIEFERDIKKIYSHFKVTDMPDKEDITRLLINLKEGSGKAYDRLFPLVYDHLRDIAYRQMANEPADHTYTKTDLVHEAYLKLIDQNDVEWEDRAHFYGIAARCMRQILIDHARNKMRKKRGGKMKPVTFIDEIMKVEHQAEELIEIDSALDRLAEFDRRLAKIVEFHFFGEMNFEDIAEIMDLSARTVYRDWEKARGWLYKELKKQY